MSEQQTKDVVEVARSLGRYSPEAYEFLRQGLDYTVRRVHGPCVKHARALHHWLHANELETESLIDLYLAGKLPDEIEELVDRCGGIETLADHLNLHVSGADLCRGLRDMALERWGMLAGTVLRHWGIRRTRDFGEIVFGLIEHGMLQKQPDDVIEDFNDVFDFRSAFDRNYRISIDEEPEAALEA
jgi:uncharacterized repeat protein (TIGR04138 family)